MPRFPGTAATAVSLSDRVFSELAKKARGRAGIFPLHVGDTYREPVAVAQAEAQRTADHPRLHNYAPVQGEPELLSAIGERLERRVGRRVEPECIQVMSGATSGLSVVSESILDPGDEVLIPAPFWPLIRGIVAARGARPVEVPFWDRLADPAFDVEAAFEACVTPRTAALYINTPSNPTGGCAPDAALTALANVAKRHHLWVVCDEAYEEIYFGEEQPRPVWDRADLAGRAIACHTLSKGYGLAGARVGFTHGPAEVMQAVRGVQTFQTYCAPRPMQLGAARALREGDAWLAESRALYREAGRRSAEALGIAPPEGGTFVFFDATRHLREGEKLLGFLERCLDRGVLLTPGGACGRDYERWVRLCFTSVPPAELEEALERLLPLLTPG
jgi:N-succinyldiaminopimelate aminotransferase